MNAESLSEILSICTTDSVVDRTPEKIVDRPMKKIKISG